jgi:hypothetical protein
MAKEITAETYTFKKAVQQYIKEELEPILFARGFVHLVKGIFAREKHYVIQQVLFSIRQGTLTVEFSYDPVVKFYLSAYAPIGGAINICGEVNPWIKDKAVLFEDYRNTVIPQLHELKQTINAKLDKMDAVDSFEKLTKTLNAFRHKRIALLLYECAEGDFEKGRVMLREYYESHCNEPTPEELLEDSKITGESVEYMKAHDVRAPRRRNFRILYTSVRDLDAEEGRRVFIEKLDEITAEVKKTHNMP